MPFITLNINGQPTAFNIDHIIVVQPVAGDESEIITTQQYTGGGNVVHAVDESLNEVLALIRQAKTDA